MQCVETLEKCRLSLSARRAWIEIDEQIEQEFVPESLSARRAWIEIQNVAS